MQSTTAAELKRQLSAVHAEFRSVLESLLLEGVPSDGACSGGAGALDFSLAFFIYFFLASAW
jgi:hypothetical protein